MADSIVRLRVESEEYEQKLKRASQSLLHMAENAREAGATFAIADKQELDFVASLGRLQTTAKTAKGKLGELTAAFTDLAVHQKQLTDEEKKSPYGQALSKSLEQLKSRINEARTQMAEINDELKETNDTGGESSGMLSQLADKFGLNIGQMGKFGAALALATGALKVAKDAFLATEGGVDFWDKTVTQATSTYEAFLISLNNGDVSGFLQRINEIVQAAGDAYNALDELGTFNAFNQINASKTRALMNQALADYRTGDATREDVMKAGGAYKDELRMRQEREQAAYEAEVERLASEYGVDANNLREVLAGDYKNYLHLKDLPLTGTSTRRKYVKGGGGVGSWRTRQIKFAANKEEAIGQMLRKLTDTDLEAVQRLGAQAWNTSFEMSSVDRQLARVMGTGKSGSGKGTGKSGSGKGSEALTMMPNWEAGQGVAIPLNFEVVNLEGAIRGPLVFIEEKIKELQEKAKNALTSDEYNSIQGEIGKLQADKDKFIGKSLADEGKAVASSWGEAANAIGAVGAVLSQIQDPAARVFGIIAEAIANVAGSFAKSLTKTATPWDWIAAAAAGTATMISTIAAIKSATAGSYATGGIIPGNSFSGDNLTANVNSGELILNRAQQGNIASQLQGSAYGNMRLEAVISGEQIRMVLNNNSRRRGKGEYITTLG